MNPELPLAASYTPCAIDNTGFDSERLRSVALPQPALPHPPALNCPGTPVLGPPQVPANAVRDRQFSSYDRMSPPAGCSATVVLEAVS